MPYTDLRFKAGINKEVTPYSEENGWVNCDKIRFRFGYPEKLNGWNKSSPNAFLGQCRGLHEWVALNGENFLGLGTDQKYYIKQGTDYKDVTPLRASGGAITIASASNSSEITVTENNHGCVVNDFVTFTTNAYDAGASDAVNALAIQNLAIGILTAAVSLTTNNAKALFKDTLISSGTRQLGDITNSGLVGAIDAQEYNKYFYGEQTNATYIAYIENTLHPFLIANHTGGAGTTADPGPYAFYFGSASSIMTAAVLSQEYQVTEVVNGSVYKVVARSVSSIESITVSGGTSFTPLVNDTWDSGIKGTAAYQIGTGLNTSVPGTGWGAGLWGGTNNSALQTVITADINNSVTTIPVLLSTGLAAGDTILIGGTELVTVGTVSANNLLGCTRGVDGTTASSHLALDTVILANSSAPSIADFNGWGISVATGTQTASTNLRIWSHDNFGEDLIFNERNGQVFYWDKTNGVNTRGVELSTSAGTPTSVPQKVAQVLLSDRDRHVIAFGCDGLGANSTAAKGSGPQDPMLIRFSSQESPIEWYPTATNTAGDLRIDSGSRIVQAVETRQQVLVFTDVAVYAMQFIGPPYTFGINLVSSNISIMSPKAAVAVDDSVYWMGVAEFYGFSGSVQRIPCSVRDYVFDDFNNSQADKVVSGSNISFSEVWWFYPSESSEENNRYVVFNYLENVWYVGNLSRTAWLDRGISTLPVATGGNNYLYNHETGAAYTDETSNTASFVESGDLGISDGNSFSFITRVLPDLNFREENVDNTTVDFILSAKNSPGQTVQSTTTQVITKTSNVPVDQYTEQYQTRLRGRSFTFKVQSTDADVLWRLGIPRVYIKPDGRR